MNCQELPPPSCRYSFFRTSPNTTPPPTPLASFYQACQYFPGLPVFSRLASIFQAVKVLTSPCFPQGHTPAGHTHTTRAGKDSHSIMIVIIIMISIRWIYIFILFFVDYSLLFLLTELLTQKESV